METYGSFDITAYSNITQPSFPQIHYHGLSIESEEDLFNSFLDVQGEKETPIVVLKDVKKKKRDDKILKDTASKKSLLSNKGKKETTSETVKINEDVLVDTTPREVGTCTLDLLPLFLGRTIIMNNYKKF